MSTFLLAVLALAVGAVTDTIPERTYDYKSDDGASHTYKFRLLSPEKIEPGKKYPLVLFLHGAGERGTDNAAQLKYLPTWMAEPKMRAAYPCFLIAPQCPSGGWGGGGRRDRTAAQPPADKPTDKPAEAAKPAQPDKLSETMKLVVGAMDDVIKTEPVDTNRIYLTGLSMGGSGTWYLAERMPERFAAVVPICGGGDVSKADRLVNVPIWCWHGGADPTVPVEKSRQMVEAIKKAGGSPHYTELPGVGHDSWTHAYTDPKDTVIPWMFEQKKSGK